MDNIEILTILKNAIEKIELNISRAEYTNEIYDVELDTSEAVKYINSEMSVKKTESNNNISLLDSDEIERLADEDFW